MSSKRSTTYKTGTRLDDPLDPFLDWLKTGVSKPEPDLADVIDIQTSDATLRGMSYGQLLNWCANATGRLERARLERAGRVLGHSPAWANYLDGKSWLDELTRARAWRKEQGGK